MNFELGPIIPFDEVPRLEGRRFNGITFTVDAHEQAAYERATWIDRAYPEPDPPEFPESIVEGFHSLSLLDALVRSAYRVDPAEAYGFNYGLEHTRFPSPMFIGDRIMATFDVTDVTGRGDGWLITSHVELRVEGAARPGLVTDWLNLVLPRQPAD